MIGIHGGDIYRNQVDMDFSVNVNPLGIPKAVEYALHEAVGCCSAYPDIGAEKLKQAISGMLAVPEEYLLFGNGASELFMAIIHGLKPGNTIIPIPSFYGYQYGAKAGGGKILYYETKENELFSITEDFFEVLTEDMDLLFLANPNNPTGRMMDKELLRKLLRRCRDKGIYVVLDECFIEFCGKEFSMIPEAGEFENLVIVRAFTKIFSIPGVRLGYLVCSNHDLLGRIQRQLPEWNLSCFAQAAGCVCAGQETFIRRSEDFIKKERKFLEEGLQQAGIRVFPSQTNFILIYSEAPLYELLLKRGILIRDCKNFKGLGEGFYRIAVKGRKENQTLLKEIGEKVWGR